MPQARKTISNDVLAERLDQTERRIEQALAAQHDSLLSEINSQVGLVAWQLGEVRDTLKGNRRLLLGAAISFAASLFLLTYQLVLRH